VKGHECRQEHGGDCDDSGSFELQIVGSAGKTEPVVGLGCEKSRVTGCSFKYVEESKFPDHNRPLTECRRL
jgi:hypothetical protein